MPTPTKYLLPLAAGCLLFFFPLIRSFHVDSAMLAGTVGSLYAAYAASRTGARDYELIRIILQVFLVGLPLLLRDLISGCFSVDGLAYWLFIPSFSVFFGFSIGRMTRCMLPGKWPLIAPIIVFATGIGGWLITFFQFPQLYYFNHVFGFWPGSLYDENTVFTGRLLIYRTITLSWGILFWLLPALKEGDRVVRLMAAMIVVSLAANYAMAPANRLITTPSVLMRELGGMHKTEQFTIIYSKKHYSPEEILFLGSLHEFHFSELRDTLKIDWPRNQRIYSYLYGNEWQMQKLTGAKRVSYVPVWLNKPQLHLRKNAVDATLRHELVHVAAKSFGNRMINASWSIGLVEGLAVALSPASSAYLTPDQFVRANKVLYTEDEIRKFFSLPGFYRKNPATAYPLSGSFVSSLLRNYPVDLFKQAYQSSSLKMAYGEQLPEAVYNWHQELSQVELNENEAVRARQQFSRLSLFEKECPRKTSHPARPWDSAHQALAARDTVASIEYLDKLLLRLPGLERARQLHIRLLLETDQASDAVWSCEQYTIESPSTYLLCADALFAIGREIEAETYRDAREKTASDLARQVYRNDPVSWKRYLNIRYGSTERLLANYDQMPPHHEKDWIHLVLGVWFRRNPLPAARHDDGFFGAGNKVVSTCLSMNTLINKALTMPLRSADFETYRNMIVHYSACNPTGTKREHFGSAMEAFAWRPAQLNRLEETLRFVEWHAMYMAEIEKK